MITFFSFAVHERFLSSCLRICIVCFFIYRHPACPVPTNEAVGSELPGIGVFQAAHHWRIRDVREEAELSARCPQIYSFTALIGRTTNF